MAVGRRAACTCLTLSVLAASFQVPPRIVDHVSREAHLIADRTWQVPHDLAQVHKAGRDGGLSHSDTEMLMEAIQEAAGEGGTFIVTVTDGGMLDMAQNMIRSLDVAACLAPRLVIGLGTNLCPAFEDAALTTCVEVFQEGAGSEDEVAWGSHEYWQVVFRKHVVLTLVAMSKMARHVIYTDPDIVFLGSPVSYFATEDMYDIIFSPNNMLDPNATRVDDISETYETRGMDSILVGPHNRRADINTGLFRMCSSTRVADLMLKTMEIFRDQEFVHGHYQQYSLVKALDELPDVRVGVAAGDKLVNGNVFWGHRELLNPDGVISIHANWMPSQLKIPCLKEAGLWVDATSPKRVSFKLPEAPKSVARMDYRYATVEACGQRAQLESPPSALPEGGGPLRAPPRPAAPGCYLWLPQGCPEHNFHAQGGWRKTEATRGRPQCTRQVKVLFKAWCGTSHVETLYVAPPAEGPPEPSAPGCYVWMPSGCERQRFHAQAAWREASGTDFPDHDACVDRAPEKYDRWCGTEDAAALWVPAAPEPPREPGCYAWLPTGCRRHPVSGEGLKWVRDGWGEKHEGAGVDRLACTELRRAAIEEWCGVSNARMAFVRGG